VAHQKVSPSDAGGQVRCALAEVRGNILGGIDGAVRGVGENLIAPLLMCLGAVNQPVDIPPRGANRIEPTHCATPLSSEAFTARPKFKQTNQSEKNETASSKSESYLHSLTD
jgi:hypothetical protein